MKLDWIVSQLSKMGILSYNKINNLKSINLQFLQNMLFGDPNIFAVEIYHEPTNRDWIGFGRMCIFLKGDYIGDINEEHCSLFHAVERIGEVAGSLALLWDERFINCTEEEIFSWLDAALYLGVISDEFENNLRRFDFLTNTGEQFDNSKTFIICTPSKEIKILCFKNQKFSFSSFQTTIFLSVAASLHTWFKEQITTYSHDQFFT